MGSSLRLLSSDELKDLYRVTGPHEKARYRLLMVKKRLGETDWEIENSHILRGYNGVKRNLESRVKQYQRDGLWPNVVSIGVGIYEGERLLRVLVAKPLGVAPTDDAEQHFSPAQILKDFVNKRNQ